MNVLKYFCEKWIADDLNLEFIPYTLPSGVVVAAIDEIRFLVMLNVMKRIIRDYGARLDPSYHGYELKVFPTNFQGMNIMISPFWINDDVLNELSTAEGKTHPAYLRVTSLMSGQRVTDFDALRALFRRLAPPAEIGRDNLVRAPEPPRPVEPPINPDTTELINGLADNNIRVPYDEHQAERTQEIGLDHLVRAPEPILLRPSGLGHLLVRRAEIGRDNLMRAPEPPPGPVEPPINPDIFGEMFDFGHQAERIQEEENDEHQVELALEEEDHDQFDDNPVGDEVHANVGNDEDIMNNTVGVNTDQHRDPGPQQAEGQLTDPQDPVVPNDGDEPIDYTLNWDRIAEEIRGDREQVEYLTEETQPMTTQTEVQNVRHQTTTPQAEAQPATPQAEAQPVPPRVEDPEVKARRDEEEFNKRFEAVYEKALYFVRNYINSSARKTVPEEYFHFQYKSVIITNPSLFVSQLCENISKFAQLLKKHVIVFGNHAGLKKLMNDSIYLGLSDNDKNNILLVYIPIDQSIEVVMEPHIKMHQHKKECVCLGENIASPYVMRNDTGTKNSKNMYGCFDMVYRDHATNLIYCLQIKNVLIFTIPTSSRSSMNGQFYEKLFQIFHMRYLKMFTRDELIKFDKEYLSDRRAVDEQEFVECIIDSGMEHISKLKTEFNNYHAAYLEYMQKALEYAKKMQQTMDLIDSFDENKHVDRLRKMAREAYEKTYGISKVLSITTTGQVVNIFTKNLYCYEQTSGKYYDIGTFQIIIGMYSSSYNESETVRIINTKHLIKGYKENMNAPHVFDDGHLCHGNLLSQVIDAYKSRDLFSLAFSLIVFLESVNIADGAGRYITCWPEVTKEVAESDDGEQKLYEEMYKKTEVDKSFDERLSQAIPIHI